MQNITTASRYDFVDAARGLSIFLVVYLHFVDQLLSINETLSFLRMPLFFFVSGLFARKAMMASWPDFLRTRLGHLLYLYILWNFINFFSTTFLGAVLRGEEVLDITPPFLLFTKFPPLVWFLYALIITYLAVKIMWRIPWPVLLVLSFAGYCWAVSGGVWRGGDIPFEERIIRLLPFFLLAIHFSGRILDWSKRYAHFGLPAFVLFMGLALLVDGSPAAHWGPVTASLSLLGIFSVLAIAAAFPSNFLVRMFAMVGKRSLYVYLMHTITIAYVNWVFGYLGFETNALVQSVLAVAATAACYLMGRYVLDRYFKWMFTAPWLIERPLRAARRTAA